MPPRRFHLKKASIKQLKRELIEEFGSDLHLLKGEVEGVKFKEDREVLLINGKPLVFRTSNGFFPTLHSIDRFKLKRVTVDMGAVPHIARGADVMAPGVVQASKDILPRDKVAIVDERHGKPLAIGRAIVNGTNMKAPSGRVVKNLHHVGDEIWKIGR